MKFFVPVVYHRGPGFFACNDQLMDLDIPNEWINAGLEKETLEALNYLAVHYLRKHWDLQCDEAEKIENPEDRQGRPYKIALSVVTQNALHDLKKAINEDEKNLSKDELTNNILNIMWRVKKEQCKNTAKWDEEHPVEYGDRLPCEY